MSIQRMIEGTVKAVKALIVFLAFTMTFVVSPTIVVAGVPHRIAGSVFVGYQAWFRCPGHSGSKSWRHWFVSRGGGTSPSVEMIPDVSEYPVTALCDSGLKTTAGKNIMFYDGADEGVLKVQFEWMKQYGIDGIFLQRFASTVRANDPADWQLLSKIFTAASNTGRRIIVEYDLSGANPDDLETGIESDWNKIKGLDLGKAISPFVHDGDRTVVALWGVAFPGSNHPQNPELLYNLIKHLQDNEQSSVIGGVPYNWANNFRGNYSVDWRRTLGALDFIEPWSVGALRSNDKTYQDEVADMKQDLYITNKSGQGYIPVLYPGYSASNRQPGSSFNLIPRNHGKFFSDQGLAVQTMHISMVKIAMFDELDEGTAIMKTEPSASETPTIGNWLTLSDNLEELKPDYYLSLVRSIKESILGK